MCPISTLRTKTGNINTMNHEPNVVMLRILYLFVHQMGCCTSAILLLTSSKFSHGPSTCTTTRFLVFESNI